MNPTLLILIGVLVLFFIYLSMRKPAPVESSSSKWLAGLIPIAVAGVAAYKASEGDS